MEKGEYIGRFINVWRQRTVAVYLDPKDNDWLITVGVPFDGGKTIECRELRSSYAYILERIQLCAIRGTVYRME